MSKRSVKLNPKASPELLKSSSILEQLNSRRDQKEFHHQFSARFKTSDLKKSDVNPYLSKAPRRNKIIEMVMATTPVRLLES